MNIHGVVVAVGITLGLAACGEAKTDGTQAGGTAPTGSPADSEFCKLIVEQTEMLAKRDVTDEARRTRSFTEQKQLNTRLAETAPAILAADVTMRTTRANAMIDAQLARDASKIREAATPVTAPDYAAAARRMTEYCATGVKTPKAGKAPLAATATDLFAELAGTGESLPDLNRKYDDGVMVSGTVGRIFTDLGTTYVFLRAGGETRLALTFTDEGAAARAKGIKAEDSMTALCHLGGMSGPTEASVGNCVLR